MSSFADNRSSDAARAIGMQLCTVSIVEDKARIPLCGHLCPNADDGERTSPSAMFRAHRCRGCPIGLHTQTQRLPNKRPIRRNQHNLGSDCLKSQVRVDPHSCAVRDDADTDGHQNLRRTSRASRRRPRTSAKCA
jgi:hypothetical protein